MKWIVVLVGILACAEATFAEVSVMPDDLVRFAAGSGCEQVDDFYKGRPGMLNPPYVYGYSPGPPEDSAVLWCQSGRGDSRKFVLLVKEKAEASGQKCPGRIEWPNFPGGLSIYTDKGVSLEGFVYLGGAKRKAPDRGRLDHPAIRSEYDGVEVLFYCHRGSWLVRVRH